LNEHWNDAHAAFHRPYYFSADEVTGIEEAAVSRTIGLMRPPLSNEDEDSRGIG
jgi:hypothetical protein